VANVESDTDHLLDRAASGDAPAREHLGDISLGEDVP
jgi:hypothetical protein